MDSRRQNCCCSVNGFLHIQYQFKLWCREWIERIEEWESMDSISMATLHYLTYLYDSWHSTLMRYVFLCEKEEKDEWKKDDRRKSRSHDVLSWFRTWDLSHPNDEPDASHWGYVTKSQRICGYMRVCRVMLLSLVSCLIVLASGITAGGTGGTVPPWSRPVGKSTLPTGKNEGYTLLKLHVVLQSSISSRKQQKQGKIIGIL